MSQLSFIIIWNGERQLINQFGCNIFLDSMAAASLDMSILFIRNNNIRQFIFLGHSCFKTSNIYQLFTVQVVKSKLKQIKNKGWVISQSLFFP